MGVTGRGYYIHTYSICINRVRLTLTSGSACGSLPTKEPHVIADLCSRRSRSSCELQRHEQMDELIDRCVINAETDLFVICISQKANYSKALSFS